MPQLLLLRLSCITRSNVSVIKRIYKCIAQDCQSLHPLMVTTHKLKFAAVTITGELFKSKANFNGTDRQVILQHPRKIYNRRIRFFKVQSLAVLLFILQLLWERYGSALVLRFILCHSSRVSNVNYIWIILSQITTERRKLPEKKRRSLSEHIYQEVCGNILHLDRRFIFISSDRSC